jgi:hypothetical protein
MVATLSCVGDTNRERAAEQHALYRAVNAHIVALLDRFNSGLPESSVEVYCECGRSECTEKVSLSRDEYERARSSTIHFLAAPGHTLPNVERVILDNGRYTVVELASGGDIQVS